LLPPSLFELRWTSRYARNNGSTRSTFWRDARQRLDRISSQITPADRSKVEAALAQRVPPTTAAEDAALLRERVGRRSG
jgi:hypothetical protein